MKQQQLAEQMLSMLTQRITGGNFEPVINYRNAAAMIGWTGGMKFAQAVGQVNSRVDYACFVAGMPMLATFYIRTADGRVNPDIFAGYTSGAGDDFFGLNTEIKNKMESHEWTAEGFKKVAVGLRNQ